MLNTQAKKRLPQTKTSKGILWRNVYINFFTHNVCEDAKVKHTKLLTIFEPSDKKMPLNSEGRNSGALRVRVIMKELFLYYYNLGNNYQADKEAPAPRPHQHLKPRAHWGYWASLLNTVHCYYLWNRNRHKHIANDQVTLQLQHTATRKTAPLFSGVLCGWQQ